MDDSQDADFLDTQRELAVFFMLDDEKTRFPGGVSIVMSANLHWETGWW